MRQRMRTASKPKQLAKRDDGIEIAVSLRDGRKMTVVDESRLCGTPSGRLMALILASTSSMIQQIDLTSLATARAFRAATAIGCRRYDGAPLKMQMRNQLTVVVDDKILKRQSHHRIHVDKLVNRRKPKRTGVNDVLDRLKHRRYLRRASRAVDETPQGLRGEIGLFRYDVPEHLVKVRPQSNQLAAGQCKISPILHIAH